MIIDAHAHLWKKQNGIVGGKPVYDIGGGRSDFAQAGGKDSSKVSDALVAAKNFIVEKL